MSIDLVKKIEKDIASLKEHMDFQSESEFYELSKAQRYDFLKSVFVLEKTLEELKNEI